VAESSIAVDISRIGNGGSRTQRDAVAVEEPLEIRIAHSTPDGRATKSVSITMRTPGNDEALAAGFLFTESIISSPGDIASVDLCAPNVVRVELSPSCEVDLSRLQRHFYTTSSCGVCAKTSLDTLHAIGVEPLTNRTTFDASTLRAIPDKLRAAQETFELTGGLHAATVFDVRGDLGVTMEDVGRHNAVDKVVGALLLEGRLPADESGLMVSGRASFELMQKALVSGIPLLAAVSAPSSLAVSLAQEFNMTLVGFLRGETFNIYSGEERITS
jgi:FdhD protein